MPAAHHRQDLPDAPGLLENIVISRNNPGANTPHSPSRLAASINVNNDWLFKLVIVRTFPR